jgi:transposase-like protein
MKQESIGLFEFQERFPTEESCRVHLFKIRWPEGYSCPRCGHEKHSFISTRNLYQCRRCSYQVSVTAGTVFHKTRVPLRKWFWAILLMSRQKSGVSMLGLQRLLEIKSYKTVWLMAHKIRKAMADRDAAYQLGGLVEMDDAFIGPSVPGVPGRGAKGKAKVLVTVESRGPHAGFASMRKVPEVSSEEILHMAEDNIQPNSTIRTDGWAAYRTLAANGYDHQYVVLSSDKAGLKQLKWVHALIANVKGNIRGVHHGVSEKHLHRYLAEFCYRFNRRSWESELVDRILAACSATNTVTFSELKE